MPRRRTHVGRVPRAKNESDRKRVKAAWEATGKLPDDYTTVQCDWFCDTCHTLTKHKNWCCYTTSGPAADAAAGDAAGGEAADPASGAIADPADPAIAPLATDADNTNAPVADVAVSAAAAAASAAAAAAVTIAVAAPPRTDSAHADVLTTEDAGAVAAAVSEAGGLDAMQDEESGAVNNSPMRQTTKRRRVSAVAAARKQTRMALATPTVLRSPEDAAAAGHQDDEHNPNLITPTHNAEELYETAHNDEDMDGQSHNGQQQQQHDVAHGGEYLGQAAHESARNIVVHKARDDDGDSDGGSAKGGAAGSGSGTATGKKVVRRQEFARSLPYADAYARELMKSFPRCHGPVVGGDEMNWREGTMCNPTFQFPDPLLETGPIDAERWLLREAQLVFFDVGLFFPNLFDAPNFRCPMCDETSSEQRVISRYGFVSGFRIVHKVGGGVTLVKQVRYRHENCEHARHRGHKSSVFTSLNPKVFNGYHPLIQSSYDYLVRPKRVVDSSILQWIRDSKEQGMSYRAIANVYEESIKCLVERATRLQVLAAGGAENVEYNELVRERFQYHSVTQPLGRRLVRTLHCKALALAPVDNNNNNNNGGGGASVGMGQQQQQQYEQQQHHEQQQHQHQQHQPQSEQQHQQQQEQQQEQHVEHTDQSEHEQQQQQDQQQQQEHDGHEEHEQQQQQQQDDLDHLPPAATVVVDEVMKQYVDAGE